MRFRPSRVPRARGSCSFGLHFGCKFNQHCRRDVRPSPHLPPRHASCATLSVAVPARPGRRSRCRPRRPRSFVAVLELLLELLDLVFFRLQRAGVRPSWMAFCRAFSASARAWATFCMRAGLGAIEASSFAVSMAGRTSTLAISSHSFMIQSSCSCAFSGCVISRPRKRTVNLTLCPASRNRWAARVLNWRS